MSKILIIGNVLKDVYLKLDERHNDFENDEHGIAWLELGFNGSTHSFHHRTSVYGGATVSLAVLGQLGVDAGILGSGVSYKNGELTNVGDPDGYRYILCRNNDITYFVSSTRKATDWTTPSVEQGVPEWIFVDRSATITMKLVDELENFLKFARATKLAVHIEKRTSPAGRKLADMADILFLEEEPPIRGNDEIVDKIELEQPKLQLICHLTPRKIYFGEAEESWSLEHTDTLTHLTVYSTIASTVLGVISAGGSVADAILWARINAENASLEQSLTAMRIQELATQELEKRDNLKLIARSLMRAKKGILAIDESTSTLTKRFAEYDISSNHEMHRNYREMLVTTPGLKNAISGVILSEQTLREKMQNGERFLDYLTGQGIMPGVKVDQGLAEMPKIGEKYTVGLTGLGEKLRHYYKKGLRFAKWRAVFQIGREKPSFFAVERNAEDLATFAKECQLAGLVPMIEPEVLAEGDFSLEQNMEVTFRVLEVVFRKLDERHVKFDSCILKCNMITTGNQAEKQATPAEVGMATAGILRHVAPRRLAGVCLLSGGQAPKVATENLVAIEQNSPFPWPVTFAFGRALQEPALQIWKGEVKNNKKAQAALVRHLEANVDALRYAKLEASKPSSGNIGILEL